VNDALFRDWLKTSGIDHQKRTLTDSAFTVVAVSSQSRQISNQRIARARESIE
jgi:hypothetical protein